jgi:hypothetical protein
MACMLCLVGYGVGSSAIERVSTAVGRHSPQTCDLVEGYRYLNRSAVHTFAAATMKHILVDYDRFVPTLLLRGERESRTGRAGHRLSSMNKLLVWPAYCLATSFLAHLAENICWSLVCRYFLHGVVFMS